MRGRKWPKSEQIAALRAYVVSENIAEVSRETGIPESTIQRWVKSHPRLVEKFREEYRKGEAEKYLEQADEFRGEFAPLLRQRLLDCVAAVPRVLKKSRLSGQDISSLIRELMRSLQLVEGEPTERREETIWDRIAEAIEEEAG